jgi:hypothetical protein
MLLSETHKTIYIAVPKTGTSSISEPLEKYNHIYRNRIPVNGAFISLENEHANALEIRKCLGEKFGGYKKIAFVRNPWSKVVSAYFFYSKGRASRRIWMPGRVPFRTMVNVLLAKILPFKIWVRVHPLKPCADYLCDEDGELIVDTVFKFEDLEEGYENLCEAFGVEVTPLAKKNQSGHAGYKAYYDEKTCKYIEKRFERDVKLFDYSYE